MALYVHTHPYGRRMLRRWQVPAEASCDRFALAVNVRDEGEAFVLTALTPGLRPEDLNIQIVEDVVEIEGEFARDEQEYLLHELPSGAFRRALRLPAPLDAGRAEAEIKNGILTLRLPKAESARPKTIQIKVK